MPLNPRITDWHGKRVWLVGASTGIGRAVAALLHARGAQVCVSARQQGLLDAFVREHPGSQALALDVTDAQATASAAQQLLQGGPLDLVFYFLLFSTFYCNASAPIFIEEILFRRDFGENFPRTSVESPRVFCYHNP